MDLIQGTLDMLVLRTLILGPLHGYAIAKAIGQLSNGAFEIEFGSLYPALKRLELKGWISAKWEMSEHKRQARVYRLTPAGKKQLTEERAKWNQFVAAIATVMGAES
jgi:PadR family transcriptional regulator, regulatory protein PadR